MYKNEHILSVDLKRKVSTSTIIPTFVQYDNVVLVFKVFDDSKQFPLEGFTRAEVSHKRRDGKIIVGEAEIETEDNGEQVIKYQYLGSELAIVGFVETSLSIFSDDAKVSIQPFNVKVVEDNRDGLIEQSKKEVGVLKQLMDDVDEAYTNVNTALNDARKVTTNAITATNNANEATTNANEKAELANQNALLADEKAQLADEKASLANQAAEDATYWASQNEIAIQDTVAATNQAIEAMNATIEATEQVTTVIANAETITSETRFTGEYSPATEYKKNNLVSFNGSMYIAKKDTVGIAPPTLPTTENDNWGLASRKGADGNGVAVFHYQEFTSTANQTQFTLSNTYDVGANKTTVTVGGVPQYAPSNYVESSNRTVTFTEPLPAGLLVTVRYQQN